MKKKDRLVLISIVLICNIFVCSCKGKSSKEDQKQLNVYVDVEDKHSQDIIKIVTEEFKKKKNVNINVNNALGGKIEEDVAKNEDIDVIFTSRNKMINMASKGMLKDMENFYTKNKINDRFYSIVSSYGRYMDKYYGIPLMPFSVEIAYKEESLKKQGINPPQNIKEVLEVLKTLNSKGIKVPVVLTDDVDKYNGFASIFVSNKLPASKLENIYGSGEKGYSGLTEPKDLFKAMDSIVKAGIVNKNTFETGNSSSLDKFSTGDVPIIVTISYYAKKLDSNNIKLINDYKIIADFKDNIPIIANAELCVPVKSKNGDSANELVEFIYSDETCKKLSELGFITCNKKVNEKLKGNNKIISDHLFSANENAILFVYNMPEKYAPVIALKIDEIISGNYSEAIWSEIIKQVEK